MKRTSVYFGILSFLIIVMLFGLLTAQPLPEQKKALQASSAEYVVIGHVQSRDNLVTISKGPQGTVYTIKDKAGRALATNISGKDLKKKHPALFEHVKTWMAGNDASLRPGGAERLLLMKNLKR